MRLNLNRIIPVLLACLGLGTTALSAGSLSAETAAAMPPRLGADTVVSLITQWPGEEVYYSWGHSAIRFRDDSRDLDILYNYGVVYAPGGIEDSLFIARFVYGQLDYYMAVEDFRLARAYDLRSQNRIWNEQVLHLTAVQKEALYAFLENNAKPENRVYRYDFILDNCSTRVADALRKVLGADIRFQSPVQEAEGKSFHRLIDEFVRGRPLYDFAFYLVLGRAADRPVTAREAMFLPFYLASGFDQAQVLHGDAWVPLVKSTARVLDPINPTNHDSPWLNPAFLLWPLGLMVLAWTMRGFLRLRREPALAGGRDRLPGRLGDGLFFLVLGLAGFIIWFLTFVSTHTAVKGNLNILWLEPLFLAAAVMAIGGWQPRWYQWFFLVQATLSLVPLLAWPIWPQKMHPTMIPLLAAIVCRCLWQARGLVSPALAKKAKNAAVVS